MTHAEIGARNEKIARLRREGATLKDLAEKFRLPMATLCSVLKHYGLHKLRTDEKVYQNEERDKNILEDYKNAMSAVDMVQKYKLSYRRIKCILEKFPEAAQYRRKTTFKFKSGTVGYTPGDIVPVGEVVAIITTKSGTKLKVNCKVANHFSQSATTCTMCKLLGRKRAATTSRKAQNVTRQS